MIEYVGWFCDLPHGNPGAPALADSLEQTDPAVRASVSHYLDRGAVVAQTLGTVLVDRVSGERIGPYRTLTDGFFVWPSDYGHYVARYGAAAPGELLRRALETPDYEVAPQRLDDIIDEIIGG
jgi:hypothetical protein